MILIDDVERRANVLAAELAWLRGDGAQPQAGCKIATVPIAGTDISLLVEYEYDRGEPPHRAADPADSSPGVRASVAAINVYVAGHWVDPQDLLASDVIEQIERTILDQEAA